MWEGLKTAVLRAPFATRRVAGALVLVLATSVASAAIPSLLWDGVRQVGVHCLVQSSTLPLPKAEQAALCEKVRVAAGRGAPMRVVAVEPGDPAMIRRDTVVLLFHASIERAGAGRTIAFSLRPFRPSSPDAEIYFGAAPRAVSIPAGRANAALDAPIRAALGEILPWQRSPRPLGRPL